MTNTPRPIIVIDVENTTSINPKKWNYKLPEFKRTLLEISLTYAAYSVIAVFLNAFGIFDFTYFGLVIFLSIAILSLVTVFWGRVVASSRCIKYRKKHVNDLNTLLAPYDMKFFSTSSSLIPKTDLALQSGEHCYRFESALNFNAKRLITTAVLVSADDPYCN